MAKRRLRGRELEEPTIASALGILHRRLKTAAIYSSPDAVKTFLRLQAQGLTHEVFAVMYLEARNRLIEYEQLFRGTLTRTSIFPREIAKQALLKNAASVILHHNHPSGTCCPSLADQAVTTQLRQSLHLLEVDVLDHVITAMKARIP